MRMKLTRVTFLSGLMALLAWPAWSAPGTMIRDERLLAAPSATAAVLLAVSKGSKVEVLARQGGWTQVRAGNRTGWVRILSVRTAVTTTGVGDVAALATKRDGAQVVAVAGLRGLTEEELQVAKFNARELERMELYRVDQQEALQFARAASLASRKLSYLPAPQAASTEGGGAGEGFSWGGGQ
ncbi:MAG: SH3 domain-containing protein [Pseudomonadota bacterium]